MMVLGQEPRQTTSNLGHLQKPSIQVWIPSFFSCETKGNKSFRLILGLDPWTESALLLD